MLTSRRRRVALYSLEVLSVAIEPLRVLPVAGALQHESKRLSGLGEERLLPFDPVRVQQQHVKMPQVGQPR